MVISEPAYEFDLSGGALCLDFVNTVSDRLETPLDHVRTYADVLGFARQAGAMPDREIEELAAEATKDPEHARRVVELSTRVREAMFRIFRALAVDESPTDADLEALNTVLVQGLARARLVREGGAYRWSWAGDCSCPERPLWQIAHSAADLLASGRLDRVLRGELGIK